MRYFEKMRMDWIAERKEPFQRKDLMEKFGISVPQASSDIRKFIKLNPGVWRYNSSKKNYERCGTTQAGYLYIHSSAKLDAPKLESVGGDLYINSSAKLDALKSVGGDLYIYEKGSLIAGKLYCGGYDKFKVYDGIGCVVLSKKQAHGVTILSCRHSKIKNQKVVGNKFYIAQEKGENAHGKTIEEAVRELKFKTGDRDISEYRNMPKNTTKTPDEWSFVYRMVTGACRYGTDHFIKSQGKLKKKYTLAEILKKTKGQYGHDSFRKVVLGEVA